MAHNRKSLWQFLLALILIPGLSGLACSLTPGLSSGKTPAQGNPNATSAANPQAGDGVTVRQNITYGPGPFILADPRVGLSALSGYTATLTVAFEGTSNGKPAAWTRTYVMQTSQSPAARQLNITTTGNGAPLEPVYLAEQAGTDYERRGQTGCIATAVTQGSSLSDRLEPAGFLHFVIGAQEAGSETHNAVAAKHYTFDERALGLQNLTRSSGELWVASNGGFVVGYRLTIQAKGDYFGEGIEGKQTWDYELTGVGQAVQIQLPEDCPAGLVDAPLLPGASNVDKEPGSLSYQTSTSLAEAADFYQKQLAGLGWTPQTQPDISDTQAALEFQRGDQVMSVWLTGSASGTTVDILLERGQK